MATQGTYYLDAPSLAEATVVYQDAGLTTLAPDGYYANGVIVRQQLEGVLMPAQPCPTCNEPLPSYASSGVSDIDNVCFEAITQTYYVSYVGGGAGVLGLGDLVFSDQYGLTPLAAGHYKTTAAGANEWYQVDALGAIIAFGDCEPVPVIQLAAAPDCRLNNCNDNALCAVEFDINTTNAPIGSYITLVTDTPPSDATVSLISDTPPTGRLLYSEPDGLATPVYFTLELRNSVGAVIATQSTSVTHQGFWPSLPLCAAP